MWECGLKHPNTWRANQHVMSLLMWECGLKHRSSPVMAKPFTVTPYVGVWIETTKAQVEITKQMSLLMWECGLKLKRIDGLRCKHCHSLCGSVDWNRTGHDYLLGARCHSLCGSVDWNLYRRITLDVTKKSLLMWECGLKPPTGNVMLTGDGHSLCGSVDWNIPKAVTIAACASHSLCGSVDWNL